MFTEYRLTYFILYKQTQFIHNRIKPLNLYLDGTATCSYTDGVFICYYPSEWVIVVLTIVQLYWRENQLHFDEMSMTSAHQYSNTPVLKHADLDFHSAS